MTFGRHLFQQHEPRVPFTDQLQAGSALVKCHQINGISSNWQNNEGVHSLAYLEGNSSKTERRHITRAPAALEKACQAAQTQYLKAGVFSQTLTAVQRSLSQNIYIYLNKFLRVVPHRIATSRCNSTRFRIRSKLLSILIISHFHTRLRDYWFGTLKCK